MANQRPSRLRVEEPTPLVRSTEYFARSRPCRDEFGAHRSICLLTVGLLDLAAACSEVSSTWDKVLIPAQLLFNKSIEMQSTD